MTTSPNQPPHQPLPPAHRKPYTKPELQLFGHMAQITQKSVGGPDQQNPERPKSGAGGG